MRSRRKVVVGALSAVAALVLAACGGGNVASSGGSGSGGGGGGAADANGVHNPSTEKGGTLRFANSGDWDSLDPADTYYAYSWDFIRLYGRSLVMFKSAPGKDGATLVPDLAESLGKSSDNAKTWTYTLRKGVKFEDGTPVTSKDVKYAVERSLDKTTFPNGPTYFNDFLDLQGYTTPYEDPSPDKLGLKAIETPDDQTIVFKLKSPFSGFDYFAQLPSTIPVPAAKDTGSKYKEHVVSTGPYMFDTNELGKSFTLKRNPNWDPATDPNRPALPDRYEVTLNVNADDVDNRLQSGDLDVSIEGTGVQPAAQGKILADPTLKANTDSAVVARLWYTAINGDVAPLDNIECRKAVLYAVDKTGYQRAYGGATGGDIATNLLPPVIPGCAEVRHLRHAEQPRRPRQGQAGAAGVRAAQRVQDQHLLPRRAAEGEGDGRVAAAVAGAGGHQADLKPYPLADYLKLYAGKPDFAKANGLGLMVYGWGADWPDGYGFLAQIVDSRVIRATGGNSNLSVKDPAVDALLDKALTTTDTAAREQIWVDIDKKVMDDAFVLPGIWAKGLLYRPKNLTNVFITDGFQMYDYVALGTTRK